MIRQICSVIVFAVLAIAGCAGTPESRLRAAADGSDGGGLAIVSMTLSGTSLSQVNGFEYRIRRVATAGRDEVTTVLHASTSAQRVRQASTPRESGASSWSAAVTGPGVPDSADLVEAGNLVGRVLALSLPAGDYEIYDWRILENGVGGETEHGPVRSFSYRFSIVPGRAVYLGRVHLSLSAAHKQTIGVGDRREADLAVLRQRFPALNSTPIAVDLLRQ